LGQCIIHSYTWAGPVKRISRDLMKVEKNIVFIEITKCIMIITHVHTDGSLPCVGVNYLGKRLGYKVTFLGVLFSLLKKLKLKKWGRDLGRLSI
jgi:hypothetical protein